MTTEKKDIENRDDVQKLVSAFYDKIKKDIEIGMYFNELITDWDSHLATLTNFWYKNLFGGNDYRGNPIAAHVNVENHFKGKIGPNEFGIWLNYWAQTLDEMYEGPNALILKRRARKMSTFLYIEMFKQRT